MPELRMATSRDHFLIRHNYNQILQRSRDAHLLLSRKFDTQEAFPVFPA